MDTYQAQARVQELASKGAAIVARADAAARDLTEDERQTCQAYLAESDQIRTKMALDGAIGEKFGDIETTALAGDGSGHYPGRDPGAAFVRSEGFKQIQDQATRGQRWTTGAVKVSAFQTKGTLLEGTGAPGTGTGGGFIPVPDVVPGVVEKLLAPPLGVADLFGQLLATTNTVRYVVEGTATSGATGVAEGATKPESTIALSTVDEPIKKIATSVVVSDELIDDAQAMQGFVSGRLTHFVRIEEEEQLLRGGGGNDIAGLIGRSGVNTYGAGSDDNVVALAKVIANTRGSSYVEPDAIVMSPVNWTASRLLKDGTGGTTGAFFGDGPFGGGPGAGGGPGLFGQVMWGKPVVLSDAIGAGTALVGNFGQAAAIARRGGPTVEASNSHDDYFVRDLVAIRAEQREALLVYRAPAFTVVSGLDS